MHRARRGFGDAQLLVLVVARGGHERQMRSVRTPFDVSPLAAPAGNVVAQRRAVLIGGKLQADHLRTIQIDNHPLDRGHYFVARKRILPRFKLGMSDLALYQIHFSCTALVLLERRNLLRIWRPQQDGTIAVDPAGVVRRVPEILHAVRGQLRLLAARNVAHAKIPIPNEGGALAVG